jgi:hypothetical protein
MASSTYDFRQFQEELAKLEGNMEKPQPPKPPVATAAIAKPLGKKAAAARRLEIAREGFLALRQRHQLTVDEVVAFFPEEEGIGYLQQLIVEQAKPRRTRKT